MDYMICLLFFNYFLYRFVFQMKYLAIRLDTIFLPEMQIINSFLQLNFNNG